MSGEYGGMEPLQCSWMSKTPSQTMLGDGVLSWCRSQVLANFPHAKMLC